MQRPTISAGAVAVSLALLIGCTVTADGEEVLNVGPEHTPAVVEPTIDNAHRAGVTQSVPARLPRESEPEPEPEPIEDHQPPPPAYPAGDWITRDTLTRWWEQACAIASALAHAGGGEGLSKDARNLASELGHAANHATNTTPEPPEDGSNE